MKFATKLKLFVLSFGFLLSSSQSSESPIEGHSSPISTREAKALSILETKCNTCHRKQNPFKVFSAKNMNRHASKIYTQVFALERMPKGEDNSLSQSERDVLMDWLNTQLNK